MVKIKARVGCEVNRTGATVVGPPLLARTNICVNARIGHWAKSHIMNGSDYAGLPTSLLWACQILTTADDKSERKKMGKLLYASFP